VQLRFYALMAAVPIAACANASIDPTDTEVVSQTTAAITTYSTSTMQAAATAALNVAIAYENAKPPSDGDPNYFQYDNLIWAAQSYSVTPDGTQIQFDPNVPGYRFISTQARAMLEAAQDNPNVASYLVAGLKSCFTDTSGAWIYNVRAGVFKGYENGTTTTGSVSAITPPQYMYTPPGYVPANVVDHFTTVGIANGGDVATVTLTSTTFPTSARDYWFGLLTYSDLTPFQNTAAVKAKFNSQAQAASCSPFNGPGAGGNPRFTITLNGQTLAARFQGVGAQCQQTCTSTLQIDPTPYATPGTYYNATGMVGASLNPFTYDWTQSAASVDHGGEYASGPNAIGQYVQGTFSLPIRHQGVITGYNFTGF
jgi:hypothetical protein